MGDVTLARPLAEMQELAAELIQLLAPYCTRLEIVGSIRRLKGLPSDIELLAKPKVEPITDMFGFPTGELTDLLGEECRRLIGLWVLLHRPDKNGRPAFGQRYKRLRYGDASLDLFSALPPAQFGVLKVIRTGSADFAHRLVTPIEKGGWMPAGMVCQDGALWAAENGALAQLTTPEEIDVFRAIGRDYVEPSEREVR